MRASLMAYSRFSLCIVFTNIYRAAAFKHFDHNVFCILNHFLANLYMSNLNKGFTEHSLLLHVVQHSILNFILLKFFFQMLNATH